MKMRRFLVGRIALAGLAAAPVLAEEVGAQSPAGGEACWQAIRAYESASNAYIDAKFDLDRATQLMASARYSSIVGKMKINMAVRESDIAKAIPAYIAAIGPAHAAVASIEAACPAKAITAPQLLRAAKFKERLNADLALYLGRGVDKLVDDQMADTKRMFDGMKARQK